MITEWMSQFVEFGNSWMCLVLLAAWRTLPILLLVIGFGLALRHRLSPSIHAMLLTIDVVRLLLPVSVDNRLSLHKPIDDLFTSDAEDSLERSQPWIDHKRVGTLLPNVDSVETQEFAHRVPVHPLISTDYAWQELPYVTLLFIVVSVSMSLLVRGAASHIRFATRLRTCRLLDEQPLIDMLLHECDALAVGRRPAVREVPWLGAAAVFGLFRQTICLSPNLINILSDQELRWVIRHELAHIRRRDIPVTTLASIGSAFHWFNPIVWMIVGRLRAAMESAADRLALQSLTPNDAAAYGRLLLRLAEESVASKKSPTLGLITFASGKHLKRRVEALMQDRKPTRIPMQFLSVGIVAAIALVGLTDAKEAKPKMPAIYLIEGETREFRVQPWWSTPSNSQESDEPTFIESYDVASIFETIPKSTRTIGKTPLEQLTTWLPLPVPLKGKLLVEGNILTGDLSARQHETLKQTLEAWKHGEPKQITIEARFIQTNINTACLIDWAGQGIEALNVKGFGPAIAARIEEPELSQLVRTVSTEKNGNILLTPKVTLFDGQTASIADQVQRPFLTGVDSKAEGGVKSIVSIVNEGLCFELHPKVGEDDRISLAFVVRASNIRKVSYANLPIRNSNNATANFTVQVPATEQYEISSQVTLAAGESVVVAIPRVFNNEPNADAETTMIVALSPRIITDSGSRRASDAAPK